MAIPTQLKHVIRRLGRTPTFTALTLVTLAIGIGANAAIFSVVQGVLLRPLPYPRPDELVGVWHTAPGVNITDLEAAPSLYFTYREQGRTFEDVGLWAERSVTITGLAEPERVSAIRVTDGTLPILGITPQLGRTFSAQEDREGAAQTVVLSHAFWQSRLGGDPGAIGRRLVVDGEASEIIGVMPREFRFLDVRAALFLPMQFDRSKVSLGQFSFGALPVSSRARRSRRRVPTSPACCRSRSKASPHLPGSTSGCSRTRASPRTCGRSSAT